MGLPEMIVAVTALGCTTGVLVALIDKIGTRRKPISLTDAEALLAERFARGELDEDEYADRLSTLRIGPPLQIR